MSEPGQKGRYAADAFFFGDHNIQHRPAVRDCRRILRQASGGLCRGPKQGSVG